MESVLVIDDQPGYAALIGNLNEQQGHIQYYLADSFLEGAKLIQHAITFDYILVDLSLKFSSHHNTYQDDYGWTLIALAKIHQPRAKIVLNSNTSLHKDTMLKGYISLGIDAVLPKEQNPIFTNMSAVKSACTGRPRPNDLARFNIFVENTFSKEVLDQTDGLTPGELLVLEFTSMRPYIPGGATGVFADGDFLTREKNGKGLDKNFINKTLHSVRSKAKHLNIDEQIPCELLHKLYLANYLTQSNGSEIESLRAALIRLTEGETIAQISDSLGIHRKTLFRRIHKLHQQICNPNTNDEKVLSSQQKAEEILKALGKSQHNT